MYKVYSTLVTPNVMVYRHKFCFTVLCSHYIFLRVEGLWQPCGKQVCLPFFQRHLLTSRLCHILVILAIFQIFYYYLLWWPLIFDVSSVLALRCQQLCWYVAKRHWYMCVLWLLHQLAVPPSLSLSPWASIFPETQ